MLIRYGQTALLAVLATLMGTTVWAQDSTSIGKPTVYYQGKCCDTKGLCATGACCKDGKCCKDGASCCTGKKCDASCTCCKDSKCECGKGGECCCKDGKCNCKGKTSVAKKGCGCPVLKKLAKNTAIIMVMPASLPLLGACPPAAMGMMPHPPMPMDPRVMLPPPPMMVPPGLPPMPGMAPPMMPPHMAAMPPVPPSPGYCPCPNAMPVLSCPPTPEATSKANPQIETCMQLLGLASELCSLGRPMCTASVCASVLELLMDMCPAQSSIPEPAAPLVMHHLQYVVPAPRCQAPCNLNTQEAAEVNPNCGGLCGKIVATGQGIMSCPAGSPANAAKVRIIAVPSSSELEMNVGDDTCVRCKKMSVKIGDNAITVSRFEDRVRVRGEELKATADSVRSDRKDRIILEGDVVLHYKKDGHSANVTGDRIELNLSSGAVTIKPAEKTLTRPAVRIDYLNLNQ